MSPTSRAVALPPASHHYRLRAGPSPSTWQFDLSTMMSPSHHPTHLRAGPSPSSLHLRASDCYRLYEHRACAARCLSGRGPGSGRGGRRGQSWSERGGSSRGERRAEADEVAVVETNVDEDAPRGASTSTPYEHYLYDCSRLPRPRVLHGFIWWTRSYQRRYPPKAVSVLADYRNGFGVWRTG